MNATRCYTQDMPLSPVRTGPEGFAQWLSRTIGAGIDRVLQWQARAAERAHLASLDDRLLRDMGLSRADVYRETSLPFWRAR